MGQKGNHKEIRKYLETNENKNTAYQKVWNEVQAGLKVKLIVIKTYIKEEGRSGFP